METVVKMFNELANDQIGLAGGKGGTLARLRQSGFPVPEGFVILPEAFEGDTLNADAWAKTREFLGKLRTQQPDITFAVRSSALAEDSATASFGGQFETVLDVNTEPTIHAAIEQVRRSRHSERVQTYSEAKGLDTAHEVAVVVQQLVPAEISGVLFTVNPVTADRLEMVGNYVHGLGEALVSGEAEAQTFTLTRPQGRFDGPAELKPHAANLYRLAERLERDLSGAQDIEWAIAGGKLYILQSRPVTTLRVYDPVTATRNDSLLADYLWSNQMTAEVFPEVMTPATWSVWEIVLRRMSAGRVPGFGFIGGRLYANNSLMYTFTKLMGGKKRLDEWMEAVGGIPDGVVIPEVPNPWRVLLFETIPFQFKVETRKKRLERQRAAIIEQAPGRCHALKRKIANTRRPAALAALWSSELAPRFIDLHALQDSSNEKNGTRRIKLKKLLRKLVGEPEAMEILTTISAGVQRLESLAPLLDLARVADGTLSREVYLERHGHRSGEENYLSQPRPYEDPGWLDEQLQTHAASPIDVEQHTQRRRAAFEAHMQAIRAQHPQAADTVAQQVEQLNYAGLERETIRSELTRMLDVIRAYFLRAGDLTGLEEDIFYLTHQEVTALLTGNDTASAYIPARKHMVERLKALPPLPHFIRGHFDPFLWAADPDRQTEIYDPTLSAPIEDSGDLISGHAGSAGRVEGIVRRIDHPEDGGLVLSGEILVTMSTNIGWTPIFPRIAAVVTDVGAPLSHAAIIARELGIPAVVGCSDATLRLQTGDRVRVDGGRGTIEILEKAEA